MLRLGNKCRLTRVRKKSAVSPTKEPGYIQKRPANTWRFLARCTVVEGHDPRGAGRGWGGR